MISITASCDILRNLLQSDRIFIGGSGGNLSHLGMSVPGWLLEVLWCWLCYSEHFNMVSAGLKQSGSWNYSCCKCSYPACTCSGVNSLCSESGHDFDRNPLV